MRKNAVLVVSVFLCVLMLVIGTVAFSQDNSTQGAPAQNAPAGRRHMGGAPGMNLQHMAQQLNLTDDQKAKIQPILQDQMQQLRAVRNDTTLTPDLRKAKVQEIRQSTRAKIEPILTPEQVAKLPKPGMGPGMRGGSPLEWMSKNLNLTEDQKAKLQPIFAEQQKQVQAVKQDTSLTDQQKQTKIRELRKANQQQVMSILTPEQQQQLKQMRGTHQRRHGGPSNGAGQTPPPPGL